MTLPTKITLNCPNGHARDVGAECAGAIVSCLECGHKFRVPEPERPLHCSMGTTTGTDAVQVLQMAVTELAKQVAAAKAVTPAPAPAVERRLPFVRRHFVRRHVSRAPAIMVLLFLAAAASGAAWFVRGELAGRASDASAVAPKPSPALVNLVVAPPAAQGELVAPPPMRTPLREPDDAQYLGWSDPGAPAAAPTTPVEEQAPVRTRRQPKPRVPLVSCRDCAGVGTIRCYSCPPCDGCAGAGYVPCQACKSKGGATCDMCGGAGGWIKTKEYPPGGHAPVEFYRVTCSECKGSGRDHCSACRGVGTRACGVCNERRFKPCAICDDTRRAKCGICRGSGKVPK